MENTYCLFSRQTLISAKDTPVGQQAAQLTWGLGSRVAGWALVLAALFTAQESLAQGNPAAAAPASYRTTGASPKSQLKTTRTVVSSAVSQQLTATTTVTVSSNGQGWFSPQVGHDAANTNYIVGFYSDGQVNYRNFFTFSLAGLNLAGRQLVGATLSIKTDAFGFPASVVNPNSTTLYNLYDVSTSRSALMASHAASDPVTASTYADLGTGRLYGSSPIAAATSGGYRVLTLNAAALADIVAHAGNDFAIGGTLSALTNEYIFGYSLSSPQLLTLQFVETQSITTGSLGAVACAGSALAVPFTQSGTFGAGNTFTAQLSDAAGSFAAPVAIGSATGTASTINATIPAGTPAGTGYRIRVVSSAPAVVGADNGNNISVNVAPVISAPGASTTTTDAGVCGASVSFQATATGTAPTFTYSINGTPITSPHVFPVGTTTVTATASNACGSDSKTFLVTVNDVTPPAVVANSGVTVTLVNGTATLSAADAGSATDACGVASLVLSRSTFTCADLAGSPVAVTLTATDTRGNQTSIPVSVTVVGSIPMPAIAVMPSSSVYTGGVPTNLYLGYGPQSATLSATGGVSYAWSPAAGLSSTTAANPVFTASTPGQYTYTVTATNEYGCTNTARVTLTVINAYCDKNKVIVCHGGKELCVAASAVNAHLTGHPGDKLGACTGGVALRGAAPGEGLAELAAYPNPANGQATLSFRAPLSGQALMEVYNEMGQRVATIYDGQVEGGQLYSRTLDSQGLTTGLYVCRLVLNGKAEMLRLTIAH
ncbi:T9SS type A sorting domain-containing protein [Hymenobacter monticola]|uniref:T9SS type A sorting domain-containing protein n=1 Tax=Hymenobacter monticola TaxID=1705399 RepID=A0ABY4B8V2_9BACT|nr:T9SS type A sorting domain-containing protein [Hymenobacter monticola]UOE35603.1 T9SS type A sorting domain-containing protein [Hymenobacter monticola]